MLILAAFAQGLGPSQGPARAWIDQQIQKQTFTYPSLCAVDGASSYIVIRSVVFNSPDKVELRKLDPYGGIIWSQFTTAPTLTPTNIYIAPNHNVFIGETEKNAQNTYCVDVLGYSPSGAKIFDEKIPHFSYTSDMDITVDEGGNVYAACFALMNGNVPALRQAKFNSQGDNLFTLDDTTINPQKGEFFNGRLFVTGFSTSAPDGALFKVFDASSGTAVRTFFTPNIINNPAGTNTYPSFLFSPGQGTNFWQGVAKTILKNGSAPQYSAYFNEFNEFFDKLDTTTSIKGLVYEWHQSIQDNSLIVAGSTTGQAAGGFVCKFRPGMLAWTTPRPNIVGLGVEPEGGIWITQRDPANETLLIDWSNGNGTFGDVDTFGGAGLQIPTFQSNAAGSKCYINTSWSYDSHNNVVAQERMYRRGILLSGLSAPSTIAGNHTFNVTATLNDVAPAGGVPIKLSLSGSTFAKFPNNSTVISLKIPQGGINVTTQVKLDPTVKTQSLSIVGKAAGVVRSAVVQVTPGS